MSRYLASNCETFRRTYLKRLDEALYSIEKNYSDMDFDNAREKEVDMRGELNKIKRMLLDAQEKLNAMRFK